MIRKELTGTYSYIVPYQNRNHLLSPSPRFELFFTKEKGYVRPRNSIMGILL